jgi:glutathione S-transferase
MLTLFHHPFCPHSRFVRLALGEYGTDVRLIEERTWDRRDDFLAMNPAGTTPVLVQEACPPIPGAAIIAEYLDEIGGAELAERRLLPPDSSARVEVRRLTSWFNDKFFAEVSGPLSTERYYRRHLPANAGGGSPDTEVIRAARHNIRYHLAYIGWLVRARDWLAGDRLSYADLAAAAHLSAADYLGDVPWDEDEAARTWYARVKSRPSFRPLLAETVAGIPPSKTYADLDF